MSDLTQKQRNISALGCGSVIGILGGLIGLGGAEFRLPVLVGLFKFRLLLAVVINLLVSLVTVLFSFAFRASQQPLDNLLSHWPTALNILGGSIFGSWLGVNLATRVPELVLARCVSVLLVLLSIILMGHDQIFATRSLTLSPVLLITVGLLAGFVIGLVSSMLGVAGGELIIPTLIILFGLDIKQAGTVSLAISIPTILVGLSRYRNRPVFEEVKPERRFIIFMAVGSVIGALAGSLLLRHISGHYLQFFLGLILMLSALKMANKQVKPVVPRSAQ